MRLLLACSMMICNRGSVSPSIKHREGPTIWFQSDIQFNSAIPKLQDVVVNEIVSADSNVLKLIEIFVACVVSESDSYYILTVGQVRSSQPIGRSSIVARVPGRRSR